MAHDEKTFILKFFDSCFAHDLKWLELKTRLVRFIIIIIVSFFSIDYLMAFGIDFRFILLHKLFQLIKIIIKNLLFFDCYRMTNVDHNLFNGIVISTTTSLRSLWLRSLVSTPLFQTRFGTIFPHWSWFFESYFFTSRDLRTLIWQIRFQRLHRLLHGLHWLQLFFRSCRLNSYLRLQFWRKLTWKVVIWRFYFPYIRFQIARVIIQQVPGFYHRRIIYTFKSGCLIICVVLVIWGCDTFWISGIFL